MAKSKQIRIPTALYDEVLQLKKKGISFGRYFKELHDRVIKLDKRKK